MGNKLIVAFILQLISALIFNYSIHIMHSNKYALTMRSIWSIATGMIVAAISWVRWNGLLSP